MSSTSTFHSDARLLELYRVIFRVSRYENPAVIARSVMECDFLSLLAVLNDDELAVISHQFGLFTGVSLRPIEIKLLLGHRSNADRQSAWIKLRKAANVPEPNRGELE